jgi:GDPmannose 4,6-dehydratase
MTPTALITGITGQDGSYLAELLLGRGYIVHGLVRRASTFNRSRIEHLRSDPALYGKRLFLHYADLHDATTLRRLLARIAPGEIYHLAGQSHVGLSFEIPESTFHEVASATLGLLEICRDLAEPVRLYHASSSEVFGAPREVPQCEETAMRPQSPYGCAKVFATNVCGVYRAAYGLFIASGIAYNHESPRRGENFVTRKISLAAARAAREPDGPPLALGNLDSRRDWGYAKEYVEAMWRILQADEPEDFVLASGELCTVREFARAAYAAAGIEVVFEGTGVDEVGVERGSGRRLIVVDPGFFRPVDPAELCGNPAKAAAVLGWTAQTKHAQLAALMVEADLASHRKSR